MASSPAWTAEPISRAIQPLGASKTAPRPDPLKGVVSGIDSYPHHRAYVKALTAIWSRWGKGVDATCTRQPRLRVRGHSPPHPLPHPNASLVSESPFWHDGRRRHGSSLGHDVAPRQGA